MRKPDQLIADGFYQGAYGDVLAATIESSMKQEWPRELAHYVIGALVFSGRVDDGLVLLKREAGHLDGWRLVAAHFFVGIGLVRVSRYDEGRGYFVGNLHTLLRDHEADPRLAFYAWQGVAFYRYFQCRYERAVFAAKRAWESALAADYAYGQSLASDLRGHALFRSGQISVGLKTLDDSLRLSERFGLGGQAAVIKTARFYYRAQAGLMGDDTVQELVKFVRSFKPEDNFTLAAAQTALAHQLSLRGRLQDSDGYLAEAARVILKAGHRRHKAMVLHKLAHNRCYQSRFAEAGDYLDRAQAEIDPAHDLDYQLQIDGLRLKINRRLGQDVSALERSVQRLTFKVGSGIGRNILWRDINRGVPTMKGDDLLGDIRHLCRRGDQSPYSDVSQLIRSGYLGFLHEILPGGSNGRVVCFDLVPKKMAVFNDGNVTLGEETISGALKAIALSIVNEPATKEALINRHWGFAYHALRHDTLIYASINRLRQALGDAADWLIYRDGAYSWLPDVRVFTYEAADLGAVISASVGAAGDSQADPTSASDLTTALNHELNYRQLQLLSELAKGDALDVQDCVRLFGISRITAFRDLGGLVELGLVHRLGKGRATAYRRAPVR